MATQTQPVPSPITLDTSTSDAVTSPADSLSPPSQTKSRSDSISLLQSSRPAPPSPASSRPGSQLFFHSPSLPPGSPRDRSGSNSSSRISSGMHRRASGASSRHSDRDREKTSRRKSTLGQNFSLPVDESEVPSSQATSTGHTTPNETSLVSTPIPEDAVTTSISTTVAGTGAEKKPSIPILTVVIRDYAFPQTDERFFGRGQIASPQKHKWRFSGFSLGRRPSGSRSGEGSPRSPDPNSGDLDHERKGWGFGFLGWRGFGSRKPSSSSEVNSQSNTPIHDEPEDTDDVDDDDYFSDEHDEAEEPWGTYRAAYSFEAEGEHEMSLTEGEVIEVRGRGGGEGWVIGVKAGQEGLVPEGYLERYVATTIEDEDSVEELRDDKAA